MNTQIIEYLLRGGFAQEDVNDLANAEQLISECTEWKTLTAEGPKYFWEHREEVAAKIRTIGGENSVSPYTLNMLYLVNRLPELKEQYAHAGIEDERFFDYIYDLKHKIDECRTTEDACGTPWLDWFTYFYLMTRFAIGRLQYEERTYNEAVTVTRGNITVRPGDQIHGMHIPSGSPLTREACMESLRKAFQFYHCTKEKPLIVHCNTWLLNPDHRKMLNYPSNLLDFMDLFEPVGIMKQTGFPDGWRVFGKQAKQEPVENWTADNRIKKGYKQLLLSGGNAQRGIGLLIFDGTDVLTLQK